MLWFNAFIDFGLEEVKIISIHLMLWFNTFGAVNVININSISIHLMLWFNFLVIRVGTKLSEFQYILCYGSTSLNIEKKIKIRKISIHLMLWFNPKPEPKSEQPE